ncbi:5'-nucleotidase C-terminal domain-containing protein [Desulfotomaculum copahuensis]|nr:5'-nucleotidase C-terminal domain-containing protein [Desulfotomaculum copahuensis]
MFTSRKRSGLLSLLILIAFIFSLAAPGVNAFADSSDKVFDVVEITDFHGYLEDTGGNPVAAVMANNIKDVVNGNPGRTLIVSGGDNYQGTATSNLLKGVPVMNVFNNLGVAVSELGNHEFDWGLDTVTKDVTPGVANYPIICSNLFYKGTKNRVFDPYEIFTKDGVKIAVVGAITEDLPDIVLADNVKDYDVGSIVDNIRQAAQDARTNGAQIVIALLHAGDNYDSKTGPVFDVANQLGGPGGLVDTVLGGHTHDLVNTTAANGTPVAIANCYGKGFIDLKITRHDNGTLSFNSSYVPDDTTSTVFPYGYKAPSPAVDQAVSDIVSKAKTQVGPILNQKLGTADVALTRAQADSPYGESLAGDWTCDAMNKAAATDFAFTNNGGLRIDIPQGDITMGTLYAFMPFDNTITTAGMTGAQIKTLLEQAVGDGGKGIQVAGLTFTYDPAKPSGSRVVSISKTDGTPVDMTDNSKTYKVATNNFMSGGGDGFVIYKTVTSFDTNILVRDALAQNIQQNGHVTAQLQGRIKNAQNSNSPNLSYVDVLATSDLHGHIYPYDYYTGTAADYGLAKVSTYVNQQRLLDPNLILVDNGDTIQGSPLATYYATIDKTSPNPMIKTMAYMKYDTWTLGNHEFNYGLDMLNKVVDQAKTGGIHVLSANTYKSDGSNFVDPYYIKSVPELNGDVVKVGILGLTTKCIPDWESPDNYQGLHFNDLVDEAQKWVPQVKAAGADIVVAVIHSGEEGPGDIIPENQIKAVAQGVSGIDAIVAGHTHANIPQDTFTNPSGNTVLVTEPSSWGKYVSQLKFGLSKENNRWTIKSESAKTVAMDSSIPADSYITDTLDKPDEDQTIQYLGTVIGQATGPFSGATQTVEETAIMDLINKVQKDASGAQLSIAAPLSSTALIPRGDVTIKDISSVYVYENYLYSIKMTGAQLKKWLEFSARYYKQVTSPNDPTVKDAVYNIPDYNLDQLYGASYTIDLTEPAGSRIKNLKYNGQLVKDTDEFTVAINNYRYNGGGGFMAAAGLTPGQGAIYDSMKTLGDAGQVRNLLIKYVQDNKTVSPVTEQYWSIAKVPVTQETGSGNNGGSGDSGGGSSGGGSSGGSGGSSGSSGGGTATQTANPGTGSATLTPGTGGTVSLGSDAVISIPAGALNGTSNVQVSIQKVTNALAVPAGFKLAGGMFELSVDGKNNYSFNKPVTLTFSFDPAALSPGQKPAVFYYDEASSNWVNLGGNVSGNTITVNVDHFTKFAVLASTTAIKQPAQPAATLKDISNHWAENSIKKLLGMGAVSGYPDGSFKPDKPVSRAEFVTMLVKAFKLEPKTGKVFTDTANHWAKNTIATAASYGIISGYDEKNFGPDEPVTREQMAAMIGKAAKLGPAAGELAFTDRAEISSWAKNSVITAVGQGIMHGYPDKTFKPKGKTTRAEAAAVIVNALKK